MTNSSLTVHVVDDDDLFRTGIGRLLRASGYKVALYESGHRLLEHPERIEPGCIVLDFHMPSLSGLELQDRLNTLDSILPIVFLTGHGDIPMTVRAMKAGAQDFLSKPVPREVLVEAIERAFARYLSQHERSARLKSLQALVGSLTKREREVFALVVRGKLNKQIAFELGTSERTIKAHRHSIMQKLQVQSLAEAVSIAEKLGMLGSDGAIAS